MNIFKDKFTHLKTTLHNSKGDFKFDRNRIKTAVLDTIEEQQLSMATERIRNIGRKSFFRQHQMAALTAGLIIFVASSGAALSQFDVNNPGSRLHMVDHMQEQVLLNLPMPETQKINLQAKILEERNKELDYIIEKQDENNIKLEAVKNSQDMLNNAIDTARSGKEDSVQKGKPNQAEKYNRALNRLETLAEEQEKKVENLKKMEKDLEKKKVLDQYLEAIQQARQKAKSENK